MDQLSVSREKVRVTVLKEGKAGILGIGAEDAKIRVELLASVPEKNGNVNNVAVAAKDVLETLLTKMGMADVTVAEGEPVTETEEPPTPIVLDVKGDDLGILIGWRGQTLSSLQYIVRLIVGHKTNTSVPIIIDVEGYKQRRYEALQSLAHRIAEQVKTKGTPFTLEPMSSYERRIIHLALADSPDVFTQSTGEGEARKVVIMPKKQ